MRITAAAVQMVSLNDDYAGNRARAEAHILDAVGRGARLILLPEFALAGYLFADRLWDMAEPLTGRTFAWLREVCVRHGVYIGTCILEQAGADFFDTFILVGPGDGELWQHRKIEPACYEAFFFKGGGITPCVFDTPLGRIGVAICFDTSKTHTVIGLQQGRPDIILLPYSCPGLPGFFLPSDQRSWKECYQDTPERYARLLQAPVVSANKTGAFASPFPWMAGITARGDFLARSAITDRGGRPLAVLDQGPGVIVEELEIGRRTGSEMPLPDGRWFLPFPRRLKLIMDATYLLGMLRYRFSVRRNGHAQPE